MKYLLRFLPAILLLLAVAACKNAPSETQKAPAPVPETPAAIPELWMYAVTVDNLILREQPFQQGKSIGRFREGEFCLGNGEISSNREEVTLRDAVYNEPYHQVRGAQPGAIKGWAYGGGLLCCYTGPANNAPDLTRLQPLGAFIRKLNAKQLESGSKLWAYVKQTYGNDKGPLADAVFILLEQFLRRMEYEGEYYTQTEQFPWSQTDLDAMGVDKFDMQKYPLTRDLARNGFRLEYAEGMVFPVVDWSQLQAFFLSRTTAPMQAFIKQRTEEQINQEYDDGTLILPLETIADRAVFWELFNQTNPYFPLHDETAASEEFGMLSLVTGSDNTPIFDLESGAIAPAFRNMWEYVLRKYPNTATADTVRKMYDLCAAENWQYTKKVSDREVEFLGLPPNFDE